ncbi:nuclease Le1 [Stereum hirsutum FP-91666 SS1]|uniref:nuclease Le1 n=1 Tax=Stereum hirsutum (strain FP-91666) TaxID=721885 RepID=UPI000444A77A|nr:nuclease Le1 [Stereum hirsutum FP-91666 SS1]EIM82613.1 nuclease Le1 [Stereum hirsutum FP-91666 SS1]
MKFTSIQAVAAIAVGVGPNAVAAWGNVGHETIGYIAMSFIGPDTLSFVKSSLGSQYNFSLGPAAPWADEVRSEKEFAFSAPFHFIDAEDSPLQDMCSVVQSRDCGSEGCILSAIQNYTTRLIDTKLDAEQRQEALKFVTHFVGDIGQPLHVEALELGGNDISAVCDGAKTNLHAAWDTGMLVKNVDAIHGGDPQVYAADLVSRINTGDFKSLSASWVSCITSSALSSTACPLVWAKEANSFDCSEVFTFTTGEDLCNSAYFTSAIPVIDLQLAKQGFRLAKWLDAIFE